MKRAEASNRALGIALSYAGFLFLSLILALVIFQSTLRTSRDHYWQQQSAHLRSSGATMSGFLETMNNHTYQLRNSSTIQRFTRMDGSELDAEFVYTAWEVMQSLNTRALSLFNTPVIEHHIYLKKSGYVISPSQFTEHEQYYRAYRCFAKGRYEEFMALLLSADREGMWCDVSEITGLRDRLFFICSMDDGMMSSLPLVIWYEVDTAALREIFHPFDLQHEAVVLLLNQQGESVLALGRQDEGLLNAMQHAAYDARGMSRHGEWQFLRQTDADGWTYIAALPWSACETALESYRGLMALLLIVALCLGIVTIVFLVRRAMRPYHQLSRRLTQAEDDKLQLQREIDAQRPLLMTSYVRKLLTGHLSSEDEVAFIMEYLGLQGAGKHFYVLYCVAHHQDNASITAESYDMLAEEIKRHLTTRYPIYYYTMLDHSFVVLVSYDNDQAESLNDLQLRIVRLHDMLLDSHQLWFYAGVGGRCTEASHLWEAYEQARMASRYTARHHVFLPYEFMQKDTESWYYPVELSAKFLRFITTGNRQQVSELLALIHKENITERNLPVSLLNLLLSDLRNTLFKARFQIAQPTTEEGREKLRLLDARLYETPTFATLEDNALALCDFFVRFSTPNDPIADVVAYLESSYTDPSLCLTKLSERFNISESYLSHLFKARTGINLSAYLERLRMEEAARRLQNSECNLSTLYADLGYANAATFRRAFKKYHGVTPSEMKGSA